MFRCDTPDALCELAVASWEKIAVSVNNFAKGQFAVSAEVSRQALDGCTNVLHRPSDVGVRSLR
jgi:hypothetical protein